ncbi:hypothetical protein JVY00_17705 [Tsukamurella tyrosinosolvens]|uniref:hypothetical protein n=1 Tax=Tsukamurella tyrosinosolvens TaxID=57704 RepID=UPI001AF681A7|nr:hypothetical protein [Tsukamurella tyrosinosolvens]QRY83669.1 hypothetical protein JVY00_17705 [Tsukamurella tyrosinosolvens]
MRVEKAALASALQRAFAVAGNPDIDEVAASGVGLSAEQITDWRSGRNPPATFRELESLIAYLQVAAAATATQVNRRHRLHDVTAWPTARWRHLWEAATST